jgi:Histidine kinase-, DNA gyrase B-, and HSP90-like ATPase
MLVLNHSILVLLLFTVSIYTTGMQNAIKFTRKGEVRLSVRNAGQSFYTFEVSDTGPGLDETAVHAVFQKYWQDTGAVKNSSSDRPRSTSNSNSSVYNSSSGSYRAALPRDNSSASAATSAAATVTDDDIECINESRGCSNASTQSLGLDTGCEGFGLGLNVSFNLVECLGGELTVKVKKIIAFILLCRSIVYIYLVSYLCIKV